LSKEPLERRDACLRQGNATILAALAAAHHDLEPLEIDILHPKPHALAHTKSTAVHQPEAEPRRLRDLTQDRPNLSLREDDRNMSAAARRRDAVDSLERLQKHRS